MIFVMWDAGEIVAPAGKSGGGLACSVAHVGHRDQGPTPPHRPKPTHEAIANQLFGYIRTFLGVEHFLISLPRDLE